MFYYYTKALCGTNRNGKNQNKLIKRLFLIYSNFVLKSAKMFGKKFKNFRFNSDQKMGIFLLYLKFVLRIKNKVVA